MKLSQYLETLVIGFILGLVTLVFLIKSGIVFIKWNL